MALAFILVVAFQVLSLLHCAAAQENSSRPICPDFECKELGFFGFPFYDGTDPRCGLCRLDCNEEVTRIQLGAGGRWYDLTGRERNDTIIIRDSVFQDRVHRNSCDVFNNLTFPISPSITYSIFPPLTLFKCNKSPEATVLTDTHFNASIYHRYKDCKDHNLYYKYPAHYADVPDLVNISNQCSVIQLPHLPQGMLPPGANQNALFPILALDNFTLHILISENCLNCHYHGGLCQNQGQEFHCEYAAKEKARDTKVIIATAVIGSAVILAICLVFFIIWRRNKLRNISSIFSSKKSPQELEAASLYFGVPVFSYKELEEATHNFDPNKELGDGGFGAVYYGKLRDGREVAVKRLYENNYKRVEQFMNEVDILTRLRHPNLVLLYGCTSHHSRELLLVYEYIPNGTVADHLHGERAKPGLLTWPIRMNIAVETASALAYLHKSDIIHRDVKSNNILLDENFCVKVADFGLSRLFPTDVSHVSTAPQGTPGYVDPEYHQCYQLTDKSDVYSFGVVLVELISSMPAVDISRHRHEINLSNLALNRIQKCAFDELIDPGLGFGSDDTVNRMTTSVAELAFRCLQFDKEMRPAMDEVLAVLKEIQGEVIKEGGDDVGESKSVKPPPSPESEEVRLLKNPKFPPSPISVTDIWHSGYSTTPYTSV